MEYKIIKSILDKNKVTHEEVDHMWNYMQDKNSLVSQLARCGKDWSDLQPHLIEDLIKRYREHKKQEEGVE